MPDEAFPAIRTDRRYFPAVDPAGGTLFQVAITLRRAERAAKRGQGAVLEMAHTVTATLKRPHSVHEGIRWDEDEDRERQSADSWLCYCGHPAEYFDPNDTRPQPANEGEVFLVFVNKDRVAYHWIWDDADEDGSGCPRGYRTRFCRKAL